MANEQLEAFLRQVKADPDLREQCASCPNLDEVAALGRLHGFAFSGIDVVTHQAEATLRLTPEELAPIAAGVELQGHLWLMRILWN